MNPSVNSIKQRLPIDEFSVYLTSNFFSESGVVAVNEFSDFSIVEINLLASIFGCECLIFLFYRISKIFAITGYLVKDVKVDLNFFSFLCQKNGFVSNVSNNRITIGMPCSLCYGCSNKFIPVLDDLAKCLPKNCRIHQGHNLLEFTFCNFDYGANHIYLFLSAIFNSFVVLMHIPNRVCTLTFASIPMMVQNLYTQNINFLNLLNSLINMSNIFIYNFRMFSIIFERCETGLLKEVTNIYKHEMKRRNLCKNEQKITYTSNLVLKSELCNIFVPTEFIEAQNVFLGGDTKKWAPVTIHTDVNDPCNCPLFVLENHMMSTYAGTDTLSEQNTSQTDEENFTSDSDSIPAEIAEEISQLLNEMDFDIPMPYSTSGSIGPVAEE